EGAPAGPGSFGSAPRRAHLLTVTLLGFVAGTSACYHLAQLADLARPRTSEPPAVYLDRCSTCHGVNGRGDGPGGRALAPRPRDFGDRAWQDATSDERIRFVIRNGGEAAGLSRSMAAHGDLTEKELAELLGFIRGVGVGGRPGTSEAARGP